MIICSEHPHHTLLQLFGLYHGQRVGEQDKEAYQQVGGGGVTASSSGLKV